LKSHFQTLQKKFFQKCLEAEEAENKIQTLTLTNETLTKDCQKAKNEASAYERYLELAKQVIASFLPYSSFFFSVRCFLY
jgi:hypothetical protein